MRRRVATDEVENYNSLFHRFVDADKFGLFTGHVYPSRPQDHTTYEKRWTRNSIHYPDEIRNGDGAQIRAKCN
jgi:hypothetical protein